MENNHSQFLIIKATNDILESQIDFILNFINTLCTNVYFADLKEISLKEAINSEEHLLVHTHVFIIAHGSNEIFTDNSNIEHSWEELSKLINGSQNFSDNVMLIIQACNGGSATVANTVFKNCDKIKHIFGPDGVQLNYDVFFSSIFFLYYVFWKQKSIRDSTSLSNRATELNAKYFDRANF
jgi:hypothetical protein